MTYIFVVTLWLFPGTTNDSYFNFVNAWGFARTEGWYQLTCVFIFNVGDTIGRFLGGKKWFDLSIRAVNWSSLLRTIFVATFLLVDFQAQPHFLFKDDWFKVSNFFLFSLSNGYISTLCAVKAPGTVE